MKRVVVEIFHYFYSILFEILFHFISFGPALFFKFIIFYRTPIESNYSHELRPTTLVFGEDSR